MLAVAGSPGAYAADPGVFFREDWKQAGFRQLRIILKLEGGSWLVSEQHDDESADWRIREFTVPDLRWRTLDIATLVEGRRAESPDLSRVVEVGFTDLMRGGRSQACSRLDWIEVHGRGVPREEAGR